MTLILCINQLVHSTHLDENSSRNTILSELFILMTVQASQQSNEKAVTKIQIEHLFNAL